MGPAVFYLCALLHHQSRVKGKHGGKLRCQFPNSQGFVQLVEQHHLQAHLALSSASTMFILLGFMLCTPGISADDFLSWCDHRDEMQVCDVL